MDDQLAHAAISAALSAQWDEAVKLNKSIIKIDADNVDALNRLARAHAELGDLPSAKSTLQLVIAKDPYNSIAQKLLIKWKDLKKTTQSHTALNPNVFLEEPGKTKIVPLMHLCGPDVAAQLDAGDELKLALNAHRVSVTTIDNSYIGRLPDDISARIKKFSAIGYEFNTVVRSSDKNEVKILIRETHRPAKYSDIPSFPGDKISYVTFAPPELVHKEDKSSDDTTNADSTNDERDAE
jgi:tetratricopeptide (TPR) repeat protein